MHWNRARAKLTAIPESRQQKLGTRASANAAQNALAAAAQLESPNYRSGHLRNYPSHTVAGQKASLTLCHVTARWRWWWWLWWWWDDTRIAKWVVVLALLCSKLEFDVVNFITQPKLAAHTKPINNKNLQTVHSLENLLSSNILCRRHIS